MRVAANDILENKTWVMNDYFRGLRAFFGKIMVIFQGKKLKREGGRDVYKGGGQSLD